MSNLLVLIIMLGLIVFVVVMLKGDKKASKGRNPIKGKRILTMNEQPTFFRLRKALPEHIVLAQVSFSAFMTANGYATRNLFNRKIADFVVLDKSFNIVAIVELDDSFHNGKEDKDADRDALVAEAGFRVIRYKRTPDFAQVQKDFGIFPITQSVPESNPIKASEENLEKTKIISDAFIFQSESGERKKLSE